MCQDQTKPKVIFSEGTESGKPFVSPREPVGVFRSPAELSAIVAAQAQQNQNQTRRSLQYKLKRRGHFYTNGSTEDPSAYVTVQAQKK